jgi:hypothetical protein
VALFSRMDQAVTVAPPQGDRSAKSESSLLRKLPWIEAIGTALSAGFLYFVLHKSELAEFFAVAGSLLTLGRLAYAAELERLTSTIERSILDLRASLEHSITDLRGPLDRIREHFDLSSQAHFDMFRDMLQTYSKIIEPEFSKVKDNILSDARSRLMDLANDKKSLILPTTTYYGWLLPMLKNAMPPEGIWALSMMREPEWDDSQPERDFIDFSKGASDRGVPIDRIFVVGRAAVSSALENPAIKFHLHSSKPANLRGYVVEDEVVKASDEELYAILGDGFIAFGERVALVDVFSGKSARGYVTMNPVQIARLRDVYDRLRILAEPLDSYITRHLNPKLLTAGGEAPAPSAQQPPVDTSTATP